MRRSVVRAVWSGLVALSLIGAAPATQDDPRRYVDEVFDAVKVTRGLVFADDVEDYRGETWTLRLDLYEPAGDTLGERPVLVWAHGGSGVAGRRDEGNAVGYAEAFARRGWVVASVDYRLYERWIPGSSDVDPTGVAPDCSDVNNDICRAANPEVHFRIEEAQQDVQAAVRWLRANAGAHGVDPDRIVAGGFSYGTVLALRANFEPEPGDVPFPNHANPGYPSHVAGAMTDSGGMHETSPIDQPAPPIGPGEPPMIGWAWQMDRDGAAALTTAPCVQTRSLGNSCELHLLDSGGELRHGVGASRAAQRSAEFFCEEAIDCSEGEEGHEGRILVTRGIPYGQAEDCRGDGQVLELDRYELAGDDRPFRPVYVWAHGGFFKFGDREGIPQAVIDYARAGWVVLSISYRLCPDIPTGYPGIVDSDAPADDVAALVEATEDAQHDMQAAVRWARQNAAELRLDASRVAAGGFSAGAITALQTAFDDDDPGDSGNPGAPSTVDAAVSHGGGYVHGLMGSIDPGEPPIAILHGTHDTTVPMAAAVPACTQTTALLNVCELTPYPEEGHRVLGADVALDFLQRHVVDVARASTTLSFEDTVVHKDGTVELTVRLVGEDTSPLCPMVGCAPVALAGRQVHVELDGLVVEATTDAEGRALISLRPSRSSAEHDVLARYHGEPEREPALATTRVRTRPPA